MIWIWLFFILFVFLPLGYSIISNVIKLLKPSSTKKKEMAKAPDDGRYRNTSGETIVSLNPDADDFFESGYSTSNIEMPPPIVPGESIEELKKQLTPDDADIIKDDAIYQSAVDTLNEIEAERRRENELNNIRESISYEMVMPNPYFINEMQNQNMYPEEEMYYPVEQPDGYYTTF